MTLSRVRQIRLDNFKAQYNSILGNIRIANRELEDILLKKQVSEESILSFSEDLKSLVEETKGVLNLRDITLEEISDKENQLVRHEERLQTYKNDINREIEERSSEAKREINYLNSDLSATEKEIVVRKKERMLLRDEVNLLNKEVLGKTEILEEISKQYYSDIDKFFKETGEVKISLNKKIQEMRLVLEGLNKDYEKTKDSKSNFLANLERREKIVLTIESDVEVIRRRLKKHWKELHPDSELNI